MIKQNSLDRFGARSAYLVREWLVAIQTPMRDAQPLIDTLSAEIPMTQGGYDQCLYVTGAGQQRMRALTDSRIDFEDAVRNTAAVEISFSIPQDPELLERVFETVFALHRSEEPTIRILETWGSRADRLDKREDSANYWNSARSAGAQKLAQVPNA